ncbi:MAG TPA: zf-HC2 domain-containing protein [bacterium]
MNCAEVRELLVETLSGTTPPDLRRAVAAHLASCAECRAEAAALEETAQLLRGVPDAHLRDEHWDVFMTQLDARLATEQRRPWSRVQRWLRQPRHAWTAAGATAVLVAALGIALLGQGGRLREADRPPDAVTAQVLVLVSPRVVEDMPAMSASLAVWKAGLGASDVSYELTGGR